MLDIDHLFLNLRAIEPDLRALRQDLHRYPETSYEEHRTSGIVLETLHRLGIEATAGLAGTGVVATVRGMRPGNRAIGLRGDMDALNMTETNTFAHASMFPGKMHGCGHDGHTVMLLGAAHYLAANRDFAGTVHLIFQPAEEGGAGAKRMLDEGLLERFPCDAVYSLHNKPGVPIGRFVTRPGPQLSCADSWTVRFCGTGGHAGAPHIGTDPTLPVAHFILGLQGIIGRNVASSQAAVLSVGTLHGGSTSNVIPADVVLTGTARCYTPETRQLLARRLEEVAHAAAALNNCTATVAYDRGYPPLINDAERTKVAVAAASAIVGDNVDPDFPMITAADDFAYLLEARPGCNVMMGNGNQPGFSNNHQPTYDFNDEAIVYGSAYWVSLVHQELGGIPA